MEILVANGEIYQAVERAERIELAPEAHRAFLLILSRLRPRSWDAVHPRIRNAAEFLAGL